VDGREGVGECFCVSLSMLLGYGFGLCLVVVRRVRFFAKETDMTVVGKGVFQERRYGPRRNRVSIFVDFRRTEFSTINAVSVLDGRVSRDR